MKLSDFRPLSFRPPSLPATAESSGDWALLDSRAYFADLKNETTAESSTTAGYPIQVTFIVSDPPRLSYFCVHCTSGDGDGEPPLSNEPTIIYSAENLVLIRFHPVKITPHYTVQGKPEYFIYKAAGGGGRRPSLELLPQVHPYITRMELQECSLGIVPCHGSDGEHFFLAAVGFNDKLRQYELHVFRSKERRWTKKLLVVEAPPPRISDGPRSFAIEKVIPIAGDVLGWVDLWRGMLLCDVLNKVRGKVKACFIPLPSLLSANKEKFLDVTSRQLRDITCTNGMIRLVEYERLKQLRPMKPPVPEDDSDRDVLYDSELILGPTTVTEKKEDPYVYCGWRLITWKRMVSCDYWCKVSLVHSHDLGAVVLPQLGDGATTEEKIHPGDMGTSIPVFGMGCNDDVYLFFKAVELMGDTTYVVPVDMANKKMGQLMPFSVRNMCFAGSCVPCVLPKYLKTDSGGLGQLVRTSFPGDDETQPTHYTRSRKKRSRMASK